MYTCVCLYQAFCQAFQETFVCLGVTPKSLLEFILININLCSIWRSSSRNQCLPPPPSQVSGFITDDGSLEFFSNGCYPGSVFIAICITDT